MTEDNYHISKKRTMPFYILMGLIFLWFVGVQLFGTNERDPDSQKANILYSGTFTWEKSDGTYEEISIPGQYDVSPKETMVITTTLPEDFDGKSLAIRSSLQDVRFYIDGELRTEYDTKATRHFSKNSASRYIFCPTSSADAGKELKIELKTNTAKYSGVVNEVYCGDKFEIWQYIFSRYGLATIIGFFILFAGIITVIFSLALGMVYNMHFDMEYLGWCMVMGALWMIGESKFRQLLVPNASALGVLCFLMIILSPLPILFYADIIQHGKHRKLYLCIGSLAVLNFFFSTALQLLGIADFIETLPVDHFILAITLFSSFAAFIYDTRHGEKHENRLVLVGLVIAIISVAIEAISSYLVVSLSGIFMGIGMIILLFINILRTMQNVHNLEVKRQQEDRERYDFLTGLPMRSRGEKLTSQAMQESDGCLIFADMDNLKKTNDVYGHKAGDRALCSLGQLLSESTKDSVVCRLGGDEFLLFIPDVSKEEVTVFMDELIQKFQLLKEKNPEFRYASISAGLCMTKKGDSFEECYAHTDKALYYVKQNGKGTFFFYQQMEDNPLTTSATGKDLALIAHSLRDSGTYSGALNLNYREFAKIYEYMNNLGERYRRNCYLVMVTLDTTPDYVMYIENIEYALECMEQAIQCKIRQVDVYTRYSSMQYLIILYELDENQIPQIMDRIFQQYHQLYNKQNSVKFIPTYEYIPIQKADADNELL